MSLFHSVLAFVAIVATLPLQLAVALAVFVTAGWPVLYRSRRVGRGGIEFTHAKFRTMRAGREAGRVFFEQDRLTRLGRLLRATHLDELPELYLVLAGTMSFVGPRPLPAALLVGLDARERERVPPGWTGLAQLSLARRGRLDKHRQVELDARYVRRRCIAYDVRIMLATACLPCARRRRLDLDPETSADRRAFLRPSPPGGFRPGG